MWAGRVGERKAGGVSLRSSAGPGSVGRGEQGRGGHPLRVGMDYSTFVGKGWLWTGHSHPCSSLTSLKDPVSSLMAGRTRPPWTLVSPAPGTGPGMVTGSAG